MEKSGKEIVTEIKRGKFLRGRKSPRKGKEGQRGVRGIKVVPGNIGGRHPSGGGLSGRGHASPGREEAGVSFLEL